MKTSCTLHGATNAASHNQLTTAQYTSCKHLSFTSTNKSEVLLK